MCTLVRTHTAYRIVSYVRVPVSVRVCGKTILCAFHFPPYNVLKKCIHINVSWGLYKNHFAVIKAIKMSCGIVYFLRHYPGPCHPTCYFFVWCSLLECMAGKAQQLVSYGKTHHISHGHLWAHTHTSYSLTMHGTHSCTQWPIPHTPHL